MVRPRPVPCGCGAPAPRNATAPAERGGRAVAGLPGERGTNHYLSNLYPSLPAGPHSGCQRKTFNLVKTTVYYIYDEITTVVLVEFDTICELQPEFRP